MEKRALEENGICVAFPLSLLKPLGKASLSLSLLEESLSLRRTD